MIMRKDSLLIVVILVVAMLFSGAWFFQVTSFSYHSDIIGRSLGQLLRDDFGGLKGYGDRDVGNDDVVLAGTGARHEIGCSYFTFRRCLAIEVTANILQKPELLSRLLNAIDRPCEYLAALPFKKFGSPIVDKRQESLQKAAFAEAKAELQAYLYCNEKTNGRSPVLLLNIIEPRVRNKSYLESTEPKELKPAFGPPVARIRVVTTVH
jgi:hypothetical protein